MQWASKSGVKLINTCSQFALVVFWFVIRDIMMIYNDPPPGMFIVPDKDDMTTVRNLFIFIFFAVKFDNSSSNLKLLYSSM